MIKDIFSVTAPQDLILSFQVAFYSYPIKLVKENLWKLTYSLSVSFAIFICLRKEAKTSVVCGIISHGVTFLQAKKLTS